MSQRKTYLHAKVNPFHLFAAVFYNNFIGLPLKRQKINQSAIGLNGKSSM